MTCFRSTVILPVKKTTRLLIQLDEISMIYHLFGTAGKFGGGPIFAGLGTTGGGLSDG